MSDIEDNSKALQVWNALREIRGKFTFNVIKEMAGSSGLPIHKLAHLQQKSLPLRSSSKGELLDAIDGLLNQEDNPTPTIRNFIQGMLKRSPDFHDNINEVIQKFGWQLNAGSPMASTDSPILRNKNTNPTMGPKTPPPHFSLRNNYGTDWAFGLQSAIESEVRKTFPDHLRTWPLLQTFTSESYTVNKSNFIILLRDKLSGMPSGFDPKPFPFENFPKVPATTENVMEWQSCLIKKFNLRPEDAAMILPIHDSGKNSALEDFKLYSDEEKNLWNSQLKFIIARQKTLITPKRKNTSIGRKTFAGLAVLASVATIIGVINQIFVSKPTVDITRIESSFGQKNDIVAGISSVGQSGGITAETVIIPQEFKNQKNLACSFHVETMNNVEKLKKLRDEFDSTNFTCQNYNFIFDDFNKFGSNFKEYELTVQIKNFTTFLRDICSLDKDRVSEAIGSGDDVVRMLEEYYGCRRNARTPSVSADTLYPIASGSTIQIQQK